MKHSNTSEYLNRMMYLEREKDFVSEYKTFRFLMGGMVLLSVYYSLVCIHFCIVTSTFPNDFPLSFN